jgi:hypothetical protein
MFALERDFAIEAQIITNEYGCADAQAIRK